MKRRLIVTAVLTLGGAAGLVGTTDVASAGSPDIFIAAKVKGQPFSDVAKFHLAQGQTKTVKLKVEVSVPETGAETGRMQQVFAAPSPECQGYKFKYFTKNGTNITSTVTSSDGRTVTVQPDEPKRFTMTVKRPAAADQRTSQIVRLFDENDDTSSAFIDVNNGLANCDDP